jgi:hypothetical protein
LDEYLTTYEISVVRWHRDKSQPASMNCDCSAAQAILAKLQFLARSDDGAFSITSKGLKLLANVK